MVLPRAPPYGQTAGTDNGLRIATWQGTLGARAREDTTMRKRLRLCGTLLAGCLLASCAAPLNSGPEARPEADDAAAIAARIDSDKPAFQRRLNPALVPTLELRSMQQWVESDPPPKGSRPKPECRYEADEDGQVVEMVCGGH